MTTTPESGALFLTAAKKIQSFIMATDKLRDMVGASELVAQLPEQVLDTTMATLHRAGVITSPGDILVRAAGGATVYFDAIADAEKLAEVWPLVTALYAPGLEVVQTMVACSPNEVFRGVDEGERRLGHARQQPSPALPEAGPLVRRNRRDGLPATIRWQYDNGKTEEVDSGLARKLTLAPKGQHSMLRKLVPEEFRQEVNWLERFPLDSNKMVTEESSYLAVVHIDINGLGRLRMELSGKQAATGDQRQALRAFALAVEECTRKSLAAALTPLMRRAGSPQPDSDYPLRPIVCAGDDVTMVMRAEEAMKFTRIFLETLAQESAKQGPALGLAEGQSLTASAGVALVKKNFPFALAHELCESLCRHAKEASLRMASAVAFHRVSTSNATTYKEILAQELTVEGRHLTMNPYLVVPGSEPAPWLPRLDDLEALAKVAAKIPKSARRNLVKELYREYEYSNKAFEKLCDVQRETGLDQAFRQAFAPLTGANSSHPLWREANKEDRTLSRTPLYDVQELLTIQGAEEETTTQP